MREVRMRLSGNGRIVIPAEMRRELGLGVGEQMVLSVQGQELRLVKASERVKEVQEQMKRYRPSGMLMSERLIAERREEVRREQDGA